jgi:hypothetical protein
MASYLIGFDLNKEGANYSARNKAVSDKIIELYPTYWHHLDSTWIVVTTLTSEQIRDSLKDLLDKNDELLVAKFSGEGAWKGFSESGSSWLKKNL